MSATGITLEESMEGKRSFIKPSDSEYVKKAKQGGDRDLLVNHEVEKSGEAKPYERVEWFDHTHNDSEDAKYRQTSNQIESSKMLKAAEGSSFTAREEGSKIKEKYTTQGVPYHTDSAGRVEQRKQQEFKENVDLSARKEGYKIKEKYTMGGVPFHTDNMSVWERKKQQPETPAQKNRRQARNPIL